jgi:hypothetical protein
MVFVIIITILMLFFLPEIIMWSLVILMLIFWLILEIIEKVFNFIKSIFNIKKTKQDE